MKDPLSIKDPPTKGPLSNQGPSEQTTPLPIKDPPTKGPLSITNRRLMVRAPQKSSCGPLVGFEAQTYSSVKGILSLSLSVSPTVRNVH